MARVRVQQGCCARAYSDLLTGENTASLGTLTQWPRSPIELILNAQWGKNMSGLNHDAHAENTPDCRSKWQLRC
jgi:hypothetical protein